MRKPAPTLLALLLAAAGMQGCATGLTHAPVPAKLADTAQIADLNNVRLWGDSNAATITRLFRAEAGVIRAKYAARAKSGRPLESNILALSGGADDGAFGAGLLVGWSERGTRPEFDLVTGVSTGSLIAPFVFVGRDYDAKLAEIFIHLADHYDHELQMRRAFLASITMPM